MRQDLFRKEAAESLRPRLEGDVIALSPLSARVVLLAAGLTLGVGLTFAHFTTYANFVPASGMIAPEAGLLTLTANTAGELLPLAVKQGQRVRQGQTLGVVRAAKPLRTGEDSAEVQAELQERRIAASLQEGAAKRALLEEDAQSARRKLQALQTAYAVAQGTTRTAEAAVALAQEEQRRHAALVEQGFITPAALVPYNAVVTEKKLVLQQTKQSVASLLVDIENAKAAQKNAELQVQLAQASKSMQQLDLQSESLSQETQRETVLTAPADGTLVALPSKPGPVPQGKTLFVLSPDGPLFAHLLLPQSAIGKARPGQAVTLTLRGQSAMEGERASGVLQEVSQGALPGTGNDASSTSTFANHLALVRLDAVPPSFRPGSTVEARVETQRKSLLGWALTPLTRGLHQMSPNNAATLSGATPSTPALPATK